MNQFELKNIKIPRALFFMVGKGNIIFYANSFFCSKFFDNEFKEYYKHIIEESKKGKIKEYEAIKLLEQEYKKNELFEENEEYKFHINLCLIKQKERNEEFNKNIFSLYSFISNGLLSIQQLLNTQINFQSQRVIDENAIDIILLKIKNIKLDKSNKIEQVFIKKLLTRYFSDYIIKLLIKNHPSQFKEIKLNLNNIYEIISEYGIGIIKTQDFELIKILMEKLLSQEKKNKEQYLINYINDAKENNKVIFKDSIKINNSITIEKNELNFVLGALLYLKRLGNFFAHPNNKSEIKAEISEISKNIEKIKDLIDLNINDNSQDENILINTHLKNEIKSVLRILADKILENFKEISFDKNAKIEYVLEYIFENKIQNITKKDSSFLRALDMDIDKIINDNEDFDENNLLSIIDDDMMIPNELLENIENWENIIKEKLINCENYFIEKNKRFEYEVELELKKLKILSFLTVPAFIDKYINILNIHYTREEKNIYILTIFAKKYLGSDLYIKSKERMKNKLREFIKFKIIKCKMEKIYKLIEMQTGEDSSDFNENTFISEVKNFIEEQNFDEKEKIVELDFNLRKIMDIIKLLINEKNINWLVLSPKETISVSSYLYYIQNKKI